MKNILKNISLVLIGVATLSSCKKEYLETTPTEQIAQETVFSTTGGALVALNGTYRQMYQSLTDHGNFGQKSAEIVSDLMGNDMVVHAQGYGWFNAEYQYTAIATATLNSRSGRTWFYYYRTINNANIILKNIDAATGTTAEKEYIKGQALALRAYSYFYLVNFFQQTYKGNENKPGVPVYLEPTSEGNPRGTVQQVYTQIVADLKQAETLLTGKTRIHKSHVNVNTAQGILARVALQMEDWATAREYARKSRASIAPMTAATYNAGFSILSNTEWIWGLEVNVEQSTIFASYFSHMDNTAGGYGGLGSYKKITKELYDLIPVGDARKDAFKAPGSTVLPSVPIYSILKFRKPTAATWNGDYLLMRAGEMFLIEAEASARIGGDEANAVTLLNTLVKTRYPAYNFAGTGTALLNEILLQRRIELYGEGFSLNDIKRLKTGLNRPTGTGNHGGTNFAPVELVLPAESPKFLMRIPQDELNTNKALTPADQNPQ
ncbi:RagB/SusD family nutrient uptake outer membrane protein [Pedobacter aquatilis]|uniref:RagB/SusD family nutrient uptake outer membrane protein n=1 Tax=Pedobacter aquatilis TaxID=351343 RepID=UPI00292CC33A|nr:RagB/SusD family nutrient uptake outer membrane protein [Pedobacter aquatilis]